MRRLRDIIVDSTADNILTVHVFHLIIEVAVEIVPCNRRKTIICKLTLLREDSLFVDKYVIRTVTLIIQNHQVWISNLNQYL